MKSRFLGRLKADFLHSRIVQDVHRWWGQFYKGGGLSFHSNVHIPCPHIIFLTIFLGTFTTINNPDAKIIGLYCLYYWPVLKDRMKHCLFSYYLTCIGRSNRVQVNNLEAGSEIFDIYLGTICNGKNNSGMTHSYPCETKCTYRDMAMVWNTDADSIYVQIKVKLWFIM